MPKHVVKKLADQTYPFQLVDSTYSYDAYHNMFKTIVRKVCILNYPVGLSVLNLSHGMEFPTMWFVRPAKPQISLRIRTVSSMPLLVA